MADEQHEPGLAVTDQVDERPVGDDGQFGLGRTRNLEAESRGCGGDGAVPVPASRSPE